MNVPNLIARVLVTFLTCYFLGNHNGAICVSHMLGDDVREHGSGNAGLTNFIRNYGASRSVLVILIDVLKAVFACWLGAEMFASYGHPLEGKVLAGVAVMVGHDFPALLGFRGGKGILSGWFIAWMIDWRVGALIGIVFFAVYFATQLVSLCSVLAAITFGIGFAFFSLNQTGNICPVLEDGETAHEDAADYNKGIAPVKHGKANTKGNG